ncbi:MAG: EscU/YscU/HrcU family type III secretion system export apparatus switch protein [Vulcanimicrobiaceae bacterium]
MKGGFFDFRKSTGRRPAAAALLYDPLKHSAPEVLATGRGLLAEEIVRIAKENGIALQEDAALVEALARLDVGDQIPRELYAVVAEVLAFVYRLDRESAAS